MRSPWWSSYCVALVLWTLVASAGSQRPPCPPAKDILPCICATRGEELQVWCTHSDLPKVSQGLKVIGQYLSRPVDELIIEHNYLPALPGRAFRPLRALRLMLRHNNLERVAPGWLAGLEDSLMELFIVENDLRSLPVDSVAHMKKLQAITIESEQLKRLPSFSRLSNLRYLKVKSSSLIELNGRSFKHMPKLEKLEVTGSPRLTKLEANLLHDLPRLSAINISDCGISWIHLRAMSLLPSLTEISLENNKITDAGMIGRICRELPALSVLKLDGNRVERLNEASFVDIPSLKELTISNNRITEIFHGAFHKVPLLKTLDLNYNMVQRVHPESFLQESGSGLEELWLVGNEIGHISELRAILDALPRLKFLDMSSNMLEDIPYGALRGHPTLERLHLDGNKIRTIEREAFMAMPALRELRLKNNSLSNHIDGPFWNLPALKGLDLSGNYFRRLEPRLITNLPSLRKVDISSNNIAIIDPMTFLETPLLEHVNLSGNSLAAIHPATFRHLMGLYELDVSRNHLLEFVPGLPRGIEYVHMSRNQISTLPLPPSPDMDLPSLRMLDISANSIRTIPAGVMNSLPQLRKLDISLNGLQHLEDGSFSGLARLEMLDLHNNMVMTINPNVFKDMVGLTHLDLHGNILEIIKPDILRDAPHLRQIDLSRNRLRDIAINALENARSLEKINISSNYLMSIPETFAGLNKLEILDASNNQLRVISPSVVGSLSALKELRMANNKVLELREGALQDLQSVQFLDLRGNDLEMIHSGAIRMLPEIETILLSDNRLIEVPDAAFAELPALKNVELQNNNLHRVSNNAFYKVPELQFLNLSYNQIAGLDIAGLRNVRSLEVLDLSNNRITRVGGAAFENMEWLVELKIDNNKICAVQGTPFNSMPRLKVLSLRNNKMTSLPEDSVKNLRSNIAVLDIDGNPLVCGCSLIWFKSWLQEASSTGPRCADGGLLRERKIFRQECDSDKLKEEPVLPGCESEIIDPNLYGTSEVYSSWMEKVKDQYKPMKHAGSGGHVAPSPEESEYFYDEYVDYPFNDTNLIELSNSSSKFSIFNNSLNMNYNQSYHYIPGDTPTMYAGSNPNKTKTQSFAASHIPAGGFTFFGMPIPTLNIGKLWGAGAERKSERKNGETTRQKGFGRNQAFPPTEPDVQSGGFVPLTPGSSGGFKPIFDPTTNVSILDVKRNRNNTSWPPDFPSATSISINRNVEESYELNDEAVNENKTEIEISSLNTERNQSYVYNDKPFESTEYSSGQENDADTSSKLDNSPVYKTNDRKFNDASYESPAYVEMPKKRNMTVSSTAFINNRSNANIQDETRDFLGDSPMPVTPASAKAEEELDKRTASPSALSVLAVPGQPNQYAAPVGRKSATITKVEYPHALADNIQTLSSSVETFRATNRGPKNTILEDPERDYRHNESMSWYFKNYNQTMLKPFVGPGVERFGSSSGKDIRKCDIVLAFSVIAYYLTASGRLRFAP